LVFIPVFYGYFCYRTTNQNQKQKKLISSKAKLEQKSRNGKEKKKENLPEYQVFVVAVVLRSEAPWFLVQFVVAVILKSEVFWFLG
jgi:hypothetical protein